MDREEIFLLGSYKNFSSVKHFYVDKASAQDIAAILCQLSDDIEPYVYEFAGIDTKKVEALINVTSGLKSVCSFLKSFKRDSLLPTAQGKKTLLPVAECYLLNQLLKRAGVAFKPKFTTSLKPETEESEDQIAFIGNCKGWFSAKKLGINAKTEDWEVAGILSSINNTLVNKAFDFAGTTQEVAGGRKSISSLIAALEAADESNPRIICKTCESFGYKPYAAPEMLIAEYPDIKPPKVKGRKPKG